MFVCRKPAFTPSKLTVLNAGRITVSIRIDSFPLQTSTQCIKRLIKARETHSLYLKLNGLQADEPQEKKWVYQEFQDFNFVKGNVADRKQQKYKVNDSRNPLVALLHSRHSVSLDSRKTSAKVLVVYWVPFKKQRVSRF